MYKQTALFSTLLISVVTSFFLIQFAYVCADFVLKTLDKSVVIGRSMEFGAEMNARVDRV